MPTSNPQREVPGFPLRLSVMHDDGSKLARLVDEKGCTVGTIHLMALDPPATKALAIEVCRRWNVIAENIAALKMDPPASPD